MTKGNRKGILIFILILTAVSAVFGIHFYLNRTILNKEYVNGNAYCNLYNGGLFCESNGTIFFANPSDHNKLYSMTPNGADVTKLSDDVAAYINADEHYVYYVRNNTSGDTAFSFLNFGNNSLCRINRDGGRVTLLDQDPCLYASLIGNYIYYIHYDKKEASTLYRIKINGKERTQVSRIPYLTCAAKGQYMYFHGEDNDHKLRQLDSATNVISVLHDCVCYEPFITGTAAYYMNAKDNYSITKLDLTSKEETTVVFDRVDCYNVYGDYIYYQKNAPDVQGLYRCHTDGSSEELIMKGNFTSIHVTSSYVYFYDYNNDTSCYKTPSIGEVNVTPFQP